MIIEDESERLSATALELLRDRYDRDNIALILIGMPGIEKWFSRYAQLYSRSASPTNTVRSPRKNCTSSWSAGGTKVGQTLNPEDFTDAQAIAAAVARVTRGNIRLIDRLFTQVERVMKINELNTITDDVIEPARSTLVIGIS